MLSFNYRSSLNIHCQPAGLQLSVVFLFSFGHPPLLVPWSAIGPMKEQDGLFGLGQYYTFIIALPDGTAGVELKLMDRQLVEAIASYQQSANQEK